MEVRYQVLNLKREIIFSSLKVNELTYIPEIDKPSMLIDISGKSIRVGYIQNEYGTVYAITHDKDYIKSSRTFITEIKALANTLKTFNMVINDFKQKINNNTSRLIHNLTTLNAHNIQEIYSLVPQETLSAKSRNLVDTVISVIQAEPKDTAIAILRIAKNNTAIKTEFAVFNKLFNENPRLEKRSHNVHKVLMNILYLFFPDFTDKHVVVNVEPVENATAFFDYESVHVALYHLIENSVKYVKPSTTIDFKITEIGFFVILEISMISLQITDSEKDKMFTEGFSGEFSIKTGKSGHGIGLCRAKNILELNGASISVDFNKATLHEVIGIPYQTNVFRIKLNKNK